MQKSYIQGLPFGSFSAFAQQVCVCSKICYLEKASAMLLVKSFVGKKTCMEPSSSIISNSACEDCNFSKTSFIRDASRTVVTRMAFFLVSLKRRDGADNGIFIPSSVLKQASVIKASVLQFSVKFTYASVT